MDGERGGGSGVNVDLLGRRRACEWSNRKSFSRTGPKKMTSTLKKKRVERAGGEKRGDGTCTKTTEEEGQAIIC